MDIELLILGPCLLLLGAVVAYVGVSYQPESTPLTPAQPQSFCIAAKSIAMAGALVLGLGALGFGGFALVGIIIFAVAASRF